MEKEQHLPQTKPKVIAVVGPTASGKTSMALALARRFDGEVVSADSRQLYRGMRIGADIPEGIWRTKSGARAYMVEGIPHHLMAAFSPSEPQSAAQFRRKALRKFRDIVTRGHVPFLVGGTGLYIRAIVDGMTMAAVPPNPAIRARLDRLPSKRLFAMLMRRDPVYAARISKENRRYIIRALEVIETTGRSFSEIQGEREEVPYEVLQIGVMRPREELYRRIERRVDEMVEAGLVAEAKKLSRRYGWDLPSMTGLGYRQLKGYLEGKESLEKGVEKLKRDTRRYAKRQGTWLRRDHRILWVKSTGQAERLIRAFLAKK